MQPTEIPAIPGYSLKETLLHHPFFTLFQGLSPTQTPATIAFYPVSFYSSEGLKKIELKIKKISNLSQTPQSKFLHIHDGLAHIWDFQGIHLKDSITYLQKDLRALLSTFLHITETLASLHKEKAVHGNINTNCMLLNKTIGTSIQSGLFFDTLLAFPPNTHDTSFLLNSVLPYIPPEQTGRTGMEVDTRSDLYSLGVVLYEVLTGTVPFQANDPLELFHKQTTTNPEPPLARNKSIPQTLSNIVLKLLNTSKKERYQTAESLKSDLTRCLSDLKTLKTIRSFEIASEDIQGKIHLSDNLLGREPELRTLQTEFKGFSANPKKLILVSGPPGVGKTALVQEFKKSLPEKEILFVSGKHNQKDQNIPYSAFIQAFQELVRKLLLEERRSLEEWRKKILGIVGDQGEILTQIIPNLESIIGPQKPCLLLGPTEAQNRFRILFQDFIALFGSSKSPLVIFLDDLQWVDTASLNLLKILFMNPYLNNCLVIGAFRSSDKESCTSLDTTIQEISASDDTTVHKILLAPFDETYTTAMVQQALSFPDMDTQTLTELVQQKTNGNPFYIKQYLTMLFQKELLTYNTSKGWVWDLDSIKNTKITENVVGMLVQKLEKISGLRLHILKISVCIGNTFSVDALQHLCNENAITLEHEISILLAEGIIIRNEYTLQFSHDQIVEAVLSLIPKKAKIALHKIIGKYLLKTMPPDKQKKNLYSILTHLNLASGLLTSTKEKIELAAMNLEAAIKSKLSLAYNEAYEFCKLGMELLPEEKWTAQYELTFSLFKELCDLEFLCVSSQSSEKYFVLLIDKSKDENDLIDVYKRRLTFLMGAGSYTEIIDLGFAAFKKLGISLPRKASKLSILAEIVKIQTVMYFLNPIETKKHLDLSDTKNENLVKLFFPFASALYETNMSLFALLTFKFLRYCLKSSNTGGICRPLLGYLVTLISLKKYDQAKKYADYSMDLALRNNDQLGQVTVNLVCGSHIFPWVKPLPECIKLLEKTIPQLLQYGDFTYVNVAIAHLLLQKLFLGENLETISSECRNYYKLSSRMSSGWIKNVLNIIDQSVKNLTGKTFNCYTLSSDGFKEDALLEILSKVEQGAPDRWCYHEFKALTLFFHGCYRESVIHCEKSQEQKEVITIISQATIVMMHALGMAALYENSSFIQKVKFRRKIKKSLKRLKTWNKVNPVSFMHKYLVVAAEYDRLKGRKFNASAKFEQAAAVAGKNGFIHHEGAICEIAARFFFENKMDSSGNAFIKQAYEAFRKWGATAKVNQLQEKYPQLFANNTTRNVSDNNSAFSQLDLYDMTSIFQSTNTLSREINLKELVTKLINISAESAGAEKVVLLLLENSDFFVYAKFHNKTKTVQFFSPASLKNEQCCPEQVINYVFRTKQPLVMGDASKENLFQSDPYIKERRPKSALCLPIITQSSVVALLYFENSKSADVFTEKKLEVLKHISYQAATSLHNAKLYEALKQEVTQHKKAEEQVKANEQKLRFFSNKLIHSQEKERQRIAAELHDSLAQNILIIKTESEKLQQTPENSKVLQTTSRIAQETLDQIREISENLRPPQLDQLGLKVAIECLAKKISHSVGIPIYCTIKIEPKDISPPAQIHIFRIIQESINNIIKHSLASECKISLVYSNKGTDLTISDDGKGFNIDKKGFHLGKYNGNGLQGMEERTKILRGTFQVESAIGKGTTVSVTVPNTEQYKRISN